MPGDGFGMADKFVGDAEGFVDRLVAACEQRPPSPVASGLVYGRDLVPFFTDEEVTLLNMPLEPLEAGRGKPFNKGGKQARATKNASPPRASTPPSKPAFQAATKSAAKATPKSALRARRGQADVEAVRKAAAPSSPPASRAPMATPPPVLCGPGFQMSPKPDALPMPTMSLLQRAFSPQAELLAEVSAPLAQDPFVLEARAVAVAVC